MAPSAPDNLWSGTELDLDAYLGRIGYAGERAPTLAVLRALQRAHVTSIPFENMAALLGHSVPLDLAHLQDKLLRHRRGGYCYEHTTLFAAALERLGFDVVGLQGRVSMGADGTRPATHALLRVVPSDDTRAWLCDVGFGGGPLEPLEFADGREVSQDGWRFRLERRDGGLGTQVWVLHQHGPEGWVDRHSFALVPHYPVDYAVGNHYVATTPRTPFTTRPFVQRFSAQHHHVLDGLTWTTTGSDGSRESREVEASEVVKVLEEAFGIVLDPDDAAGLEAWAAASTAAKEREEPAQ